MPLLMGRNWRDYRAAGAPVNATAVAEPSKVSLHRRRFLRLGVAQGRDLDRGDLVALAAEDLEAEAVEHEHLAHFGNAARFVENQAV